MSATSSRWTPGLRRKTFLLLNLACAMEICQRYCMPTHMANQTMSPGAHTYRLGKRRLPELLSRPPPKALDGEPARPLANGKREPEPEPAGASIGELAPEPLAERVPMLSCGRPSRLIVPGRLVAGAIMILSSTFDACRVFQLNLKGAWPGYMICICDGGASCESLCGSAVCQDLLGMLCAAGGLCKRSVLHQQPARLSLRQ